MSCPLKKCHQKARSRKNEWITKGILISREKLLFFSEIRNHSTDEDFKHFFQNYKRIYKKVIRAAKAHNVKTKLLTSKNVSKTAWAIIKNKNPQANKQIELLMDNEKTSNAEKVVDAFNNLFASVGSDQKIGSVQHEPQPYLRTPASSMVLTPVTEEEITSVIKDLPSKNSYDSNYVSTWLLKQCVMHLKKPLEHLINLSFQSGIFPSSLKKAKITPIYKKGDPTSIQNYRPISILPVLSKVFEKLFFIRLVHFLDTNNILSHSQFGFRNGKSTIDAVVHLVDSIVQGIENQRDTLSVFLDLSKAFDCVDHGLLTHKLESYGIRGVPLLWLNSFLGNRTQFVKISDVQSGERGLEYGVPQGSNLSPLLFLLYVNDVGSSLQQGQIVQYADDTTLSFNAKSNADLELITFTDLNNVIQHFNNLNLKTNSSKSNFIKFSLRQTTLDCSPTVLLDETEIEEVYSTKFLGIHLDRGLTWFSHVDNVCSKLASGIYVLRQLSKYCPTQILMTAYYGLIYPHLSYGVALWGACANTHFSRVFTLQKKAVRTIAKLQWRESCRPTFRSLQLLTLPCLYILETCIFFKSKCNSIRGDDLHSYETRGRSNYRTGKHRTVVYERLPSQAGARFVNLLPNSIKNATVPKAFKTRLKNSLTAEAFYSTDEFMAHIWET